MNTVILYPKDKVAIKTSSKGSQAKWNKNNKWYKQDMVGFESAGEVIASRVAHLLNIQMPIVDYSPCWLSLPTGMFMGCESDSFLTAGDVEITAQRLLNAAHLQFSTPLEEISYIVTKHPHLADQLSCLLQFDRLIRNHDRHLHNIVIRNLTDIIVFDNGDSCTADITYDYPYGISVRDILAVDLSKPLMKSFDTACNDMREFSSFTLEAVYNQLQVSDLYSVYPDWFMKRVIWLLSYQFQKYLNTDLQFI